MRPEEIAAALRSAAGRLERLLDTCRRGQVLKSGVRTAIVGRPTRASLRCSTPWRGMSGPSSPTSPAPPGTRWRSPYSAAGSCCGSSIPPASGPRRTRWNSWGWSGAGEPSPPAELVLAVVDGAVPEDSEEGSLLADVARCGVPWLLVFTKRDMAGGCGRLGRSFPPERAPGPACRRGVPCPPSLARDWRTWETP